MVRTYRQIYRIPSRSVIENGYRALAVAIINLAVEDLKSAASHHDMGRIRELEHFFCGGWCMMLIPPEWGTDGTTIYKRILSGYPDISEASEEPTPIQVLDSYVPARKEEEALFDEVDYMKKYGSRDNVRIAFKQYSAALHKFVSIGTKLDAILHRASLTIRQHDALEYKYKYGYTTKEISVLMVISPQQVWDAIKGGREIVRTYDWRDENVTSREILMAYRPIAEERDDFRRRVEQCKKMGLYSAKLWHRYELECSKARDAEESAEQIIDKVRKPDHRKLLRMRYLEGLSPAEIQQIMGWTKRQYTYAMGQAHKAVDVQDEAKQDGNV